MKIDILEICQICPLTKVTCAGRAEVAMSRGLCSLLQVRMVLAGIGYVSFLSVIHTLSDTLSPDSPDSSPRRLPVSKANSDNAHAHSQCMI